jgi:predicted ester cyclase
MRGTHPGTFNDVPPTGRTVEVEHIHIARIVDGKGTDHWAMIDMLGLLQQLGVVPATPAAALA